MSYYSFGSSDFFGDAFYSLFSFFATFSLVFIAALVVAVIALWKIFEKAGRKGYYAVIPFYNVWVLYEIVGLEGWYFLLGLIPFVGIFIALVFSIICDIRLSKAFGKDTGFAIGLIFLPVIFLPILGFSNDSIYYGLDVNGNTLKK